MSVWPRDTLNVALFNAKMEEKGFTKQFVAKQLPMCRHSASQLFARGWLPTSVNNKNETIRVLSEILGVPEQDLIVKAAK